MTVADDLIAVRTLLILQGRAVGALKDDEGKVCLRQAMRTVTGDPRRYTGVDPEHEGDAAFWRDKAMHEALLRHLPEGVLAAHAKDDHYSLNPNESALAAFNDSQSVTDQDVFDLIEKAIANEGGMA